MPNPKFCRDCRYCGPFAFAASGADLTKCQRSSAAKTDVSPVTGERYRAEDIRYAEIERLSLSEPACGPSARFFAPRLEVA